jgi:hypothetical protein
MQCSGRMAHVAAPRKWSALAALARRCAAAPAPAAPRAAAGALACGRAPARTPCGADADAAGGAARRVRAAAAAARGPHAPGGHGRHVASAAAAAGGGGGEGDPLAFETVSETCPGCGVCLQSSNPDKPGCVGARAAAEGVALARRAR